MLVLAFLHLALASGAQGKNWKGKTISWMFLVDGVSFAVLFLSSSVLCPSMPKWFQILQQSEK